MKNLLSALSLGLLCALSSCSQNDKATNEPTPTASYANLADAGGGKMRIFYILDGDCYPPAVNCFPEVVIQPPSAVGFAQDVQSIEGDPISVKNYFNGKSWKNYFIQLDRPENLKYLNKLRSGQYNMLKYTSKESGKTFYMFGKGEIDVNKPEMVFPVN